MTGHHGQNQCDGLSGPLSFGMIGKGLPGPRCRLDVGFLYISWPLNSRTASAFGDGTRCLVCLAVWSMSTEPLAVRLGASNLTAKEVVYKWIEMRRENESTAGQQNLER